MKSEAEMTSPNVCQAITNSVEGNESLREYLRRRALVFLRGLARRYRGFVRAQEPRPLLPGWTNEASNVQKDDFVRVRSLEEISQTLDERGYTKGCKFMAQMAGYCGQHYRVAGRIEMFFDEARCRTLQCKNLVLLDHVYCDGSAVGGCDRMCFLFWRTEWLEKLE